MRLTYYGRGWRGRLCPVARTRRRRSASPGVLIHDSAILEAVDERQVAASFQLAERESRQRGFQYIALINSDTLPEKELFQRGFDIDDYLSIRLTDADPAGSLFGQRF